MASPVLFSTGAAPATTSGSRNLVEFKAGKMEMKERKVHPIKRQGMVFLRQSPDDNLMHFCWKDRQTGAVEDDLILFPDDCEFSRVKECTTGRVFVLKMKSSNKKMFFWMQEAKPDKDEEYCKKINEMLNNPPRGGSEMGGGGSSASDRDLSSLFGNMTQDQLAQLLSSNGANLAQLLSSAAGRSSSNNSGASSTASTTNSAPTSANSATGAATGGASASSAGRDPSASDLRALIANAMAMDDSDESLMAAMAASQAEASGSSQARESQQQQQQQQTPLIDLSTAINSDSLAYLLSDEEFLRHIEPHLPPVSQPSLTNPSSSSNLTPEDRKQQFADTVRSSQFRSSLSQFCVALQSGQLGPLMSQFGLSQACVDAANLGNLEAFVRALETHASSTTSSSSTSGPNQPKTEPKE